VQQFVQKLVCAMVLTPVLQEGYIISFQYDPIQGEPKKVKFRFLFWSERSACAVRAALQTGCVANEVGT
jgi:hypothetical protein